MSKATPFCSNGGATNSLSGSVLQMRYEKTVAETINLLPVQAWHVTQHLGRQQHLWPWAELASGGQSPQSPLPGKAACIWQFILARLLFTECLAEVVSGVSVMQENACFSLISVSFEKMRCYTQTAVCITQKTLRGAAVLSFQLSSARDVGVHSKGKAAARKQQGLAAGRKEE